MVIADIVLVGAVPRGKALLRSGARAGDLLYVTGSLGGAAADGRLAESGGGVRVRWPGEGAEASQGLEGLTSRLTFTRSLALHRDFGCAGMGWLLRR